jgi:hypothetical protein
MSEDEPTVHKTAARSPVELERAMGVGHLGAVKAQSLLGSLGSSELDETVSSIAVNS